MRGIRQAPRKARANILGWPLISDSRTPSMAVTTQLIATVKATSKAQRPVRRPFITHDCHSGTAVYASYASDQVYPVPGTTASAL